MYLIVYLCSCGNMKFSLMTSLWESYIRSFSASFPSINVSWSCCSNFKSMRLIHMMRVLIRDCPTFCPLKNSTSRWHTCRLNIQMVSSKTDLMIHREIWLYNCIVAALLLRMCSAISWRGFYLFKMRPDEELLHAPKHQESSRRKVDY